MTVRIASNAISGKVKLGVPSRKGGFSGLVVETNVPVLAVFLGGAIAIGILWVLQRSKPQAPQAAPAAVDPPTNLAVARVR